MDYQAVVFDLDGTLVDSAPDMAAALNAALAEVNLDPFGLDEVISFVGSGGRILVRRALAARAAGHLDEAVMLGRFIGHYEGKLSGQTQPYPGVMEMLARLTAAGVPMGLCTNKPEGPARGVCAALGLDAHFPVIVGGDTLPVLKPDPAPLLHVCAELGLEPCRVLYVGDSETDYATARAAKTPFAFVEGGYQSRPIPDFAPTHHLSAPHLVGDLVLGAA
jgi:phosphoglycolate phosphatase